MRRRRRPSSSGISSAAWSCRALSKLLIVLGLVLVAAGIAMQFGVPLGRLPGDLTFKRGNTTVYLPLATSLLASVVLSVIVMYFRR